MRKDVPPSIVSVNSWKRPLTLKDHLIRWGWIIAWTLFAQWTPRSMHGWRRLVLNAFGADIAHGARVHPRARIWFPPNLIMEVGAVLADDVECFCLDRIRIGRGATVGSRASLFTGLHRKDGFGFRPLIGPIELECGSSVGADAIVHPGVTIGTNTALEAGSVAQHELRHNAIYHGNPAKPIAFFDT